MITVVCISWNVVFLKILKKPFLVLAINDTSYESQADFNWRKNFENPKKQIPISKLIFIEDFFFENPKKTNCLILPWLLRGRIRQIFHSFFEACENKKICLWDILTFRAF